VQDEELVAIDVDNLLHFFQDSSRCDKEHPMARFKYPPIHGEMRFGCNPDKIFPARFFLVLMRRYYLCGSVESFRGSNFKPRLLTRSQIASVLIHIKN